MANGRMTSIERQQARLGGLLEGLREALSSERDHNELAASFVA